MFLMIVIALIMAFAVYAIMTAPEGYEDESGFHPGRPPEDEDEFLF
jgi:hypothetical protein